MKDNKVNQITATLSFCAVSGFIGVMLGGFMSESVSRKYTKKNQVINSLKTEIVDTKTFIKNGDTIISSRKIPARVVADSLLLNIQP